MQIRTSDYQERGAPNPLTCSNHAASLGSARVSILVFPPRDLGPHRAQHYLPNNFLAFRACPISTSASSKESLSARPADHPSSLGLNRVPELPSNGVEAAGPLCSAVWTSRFDIPKFHKTRWSLDGIAGLSRQLHPSYHLHGMAGRPTSASHQSWISTVGENFQFHSIASCHKVRNGWHRLKRGSLRRPHPPTPHRLRRPISSDLGWSSQALQGWTGDRKSPASTACQASQPASVGTRWEPVLIWRCALTPTSSLVHHMAGLLPESQG